MCTFKNRKKKTATAAAGSVILHRFWNVSRAQLLLAAFGSAENTSVAVTVCVCVCVGAGHVTPLASRESRAGSCCASAAYYSHAEASDGGDPRKEKHTAGGTESQRMQGASSAFLFGNKVLNHKAVEFCGLFQ